jgi:hypothetical protein
MVLYGTRIVQRSPCAQEIVLDDEEVLPELAYKNGIVRAVKPPADLPRADYFKYARLARVPMKPAKAMNDMLHATACKM